MTHTCDKARSGSERSENTCAACQDDLKRHQERNPPDYSWLYEPLKDTGKKALR